MVTVSVTLCYCEQISAIQTFHDGQQGPGEAAVKFVSLLKNVSGNLLSLMIVLEPPRTICVFLQKENIIGNFLSIKGKGALEGLAHWQHKAMHLQYFNAPLSGFLFYFTKCIPLVIRPQFSSRKNAFFLLIKSLCASLIEFMMCSSVTVSEILEFSISTKDKATLQVLE